MSSSFERVAGLFVSLLLKTQGTAGLLPAIPFEEKPNSMKVWIRKLGYLCRAKDIIHERDETEWNLAWIRRLCRKIIKTLLTSFVIGIGDNISLKTSNVKLNINDVCNLIKLLI
jgi:hypothetical protein